MIGTVRTIVVLIAVTLLTLVLGPLQWFGVTTGLYQGRRLLRLWHRSVVRLLGLRIHVFGDLAAGRPLMIAANHISWTDIPVLAAVADVSFIAKSEMSGWPVFGWFSRMQRSIYVEREARRKSGEQASEIAGRLAAGDVVVLFAEGTTGDGNSLLPFKSTLFGAAPIILAATHHAEMWIQPVALAYTRLHGMPMGRRQRSRIAWIGDEDLVPHLAALLREGALDVEVHFGAPVPFTAASSRKEVARIVEDRVRDMLRAAIAHPAPHA